MISHIYRKSVSLDSTFSTFHIYGIDLHCIAAYLPDFFRHLLYPNTASKKTTGQDPQDISGEKPKGDIRLKADTGEQYIYNVDSQTLKKT